jgi:DNA-binding CsgD family transcriptional regulator
MELYAKDESRQWQNWGSRVYNNSFVHNAYFDITLLCSEEHLVTFLQPLKDKYKVALSYYEQLNLTKRETEIISLIIQGISNCDIYKKLSVSKATLKTHLNNIYKKVDDQGLELKYIPNNRLSARG